ncbi:MAG: sigma-70 family RNA polymerase sigma factor [Clostridia bacterium]|nr:sigma-70 family RNA polymerase sigma factor [Clostridia bacterium]
MNDPDVIKLYFERSEQAVSETKQKYGNYMRSIAKRILRDERDVEEVVSDAVLAAWNSIPPESPRDLAAYLGRLCRNAAVDRARANSRKKRGGGEYEAVLDEIAELVPSAEAGPEEAAERLAVTGAINGFLASLPKKKRTMFVQRYWYLMSEGEIAREHLMTRSAVSMQLSRLRAALKEHLKKEDVDL